MNAEAAIDDFTKLDFMEQPLQDPEDHFFVKTDKRTEKVYFDELLYAEAMWSYVLLYTVSRKIIGLISLESLGNQLPGRIFSRVHKSFIVNLSKINFIKGNEIVIGKEKITISKELREKVLNDILKNRP
jgi:DNA-binding LytR/AlgR family response regulator